MIYTQRLDSQYPTCPFQRNRNTVHSKARLKVSHRNTHIREYGNAGTHTYLIAGLKVYAHPYQECRNTHTHTYSTAGLEVSHAFHPEIQEYTYTRRLDSKSPARTVQECRHAVYPMAGLKVSYTSHPGMQEYAHIPDAWTRSLPRVTSSNGGVHKYPTAGLTVSPPSRLGMQEYTPTARLNISRASHPGKQE